ncbi:MAG: hypothetical protein KIG88_11485 [Weeksellaceae bacterium]|nr:hypothetical protein [Weeksellaceae bacterium]
MNYKILILSLFISIQTSISLNAQVVNQDEIGYDISTMEEKYPEVFTTIKPQNPDTAYEIGKRTQGFLQDFIGENGKAQFYLIYAQHLQKLNQSEQITAYRPKVILLLQSINRINQLIDTKVAYYDQMQSLLVAYAEHALFEAQSVDSSKFEKIDVNKQKKLFIKSIQQKVKTKNQQLNLNTFPNYNKNQEIIEQEIKSIENLISDTFLLKSAQIFHYTYY